MIRQFGRIGLVYQLTMNGGSKQLKLFTHQNLPSLTAFRTGMANTRNNILKPSDCPSDEELCGATPADKDDVLAIEPDGYEGYDYLPSTYKQFVCGQGVTGYLYKKGGKVVGFLSTSLVDDGETLATSAGRINVNWRGRGMYGRFKRRVFQRSLETNPKLRYNIMLTHNLNWDTNGQKLQKMYRILEESDLMSYDFDTLAARRRSLPKQSEIPGIRQMTREDIRNLMKENPDHLFPKGRITLETKAYRVMEANTDLIFYGGFNRTFIGSYPCTNSHTAHHAGGHSPSVISCGSYYECKMGIVNEVSLYGTGSDAVLRAHIEWHLLRLLEVADGKPALFDPSAAVDLTTVMDKLMDVFPLSRLDLPYKKSLLLEMDLRPC